MIEHSDQKITLGEKGLFALYYHGNPPLIEVKAGTGNTNCEGMLLVGSLTGLYNPGPLAYAWSRQHWSSSSRVN